MVAFINLALVLLCLLWGLTTELPSLKDWCEWRSRPFAVVKEEVYCEYVRRQLVLAVGNQQAPAHPADLTFFQQLKQMLRPFNAETAFFFPSVLLAGVILALFSYVWILFQSV